MEESGKIIGVRKKIAIVEIEKKSQCGKCCACKFSKEGKMLIEVENVLNANVGDNVLLQIEDKDILKASVIVYLLPTIVFLSSVILSQYFLSRTSYLEKIQQLLSLLIGFSFLCICFVIINLYDKKIQKTTSYKPKMTKLIK